MIIRIVVYFKNCCPLFVPTFKAQIGGVFFVSDASDNGLIFFITCANSATSAARFLCGLDFAHF